MKPNILFFSLLLLVVSAKAQMQQSPPLKPAPALDTRAPALSKTGSFILQHADVPLYPRIAKTAHLAGTVVVRVTVKRGTVISAEPSSSAHTILVNAATGNVKTWQFAPDSSGVLDVTYVYEIEKEESDSPQNPHVEMVLPSLVKIRARPTTPTTN